MNQETYRIIPYYGYNYPINSRGPFRQGVVPFPHLPWSGHILTTPITSEIASNYTCKPGYVWREAVRGDFVCVSPQTRDETAAENALGPSRRQPGGGAYGPDTCKQGFFWRETRPSDHVCVPYHRRERARVDNELAPYTMAYPPAAPSHGISVRDEYRDNQVVYKVFATFIPNGKVAFYAYDAGDYYGGPLRLLNKFPTDANGNIEGFYEILEGRQTFYKFPCSRDNYNYRLRKAPIIVVDEKSGIVSNAGELRIPPPQCAWMPPSSII